VEEIVRAVRIAAQISSRVPCANRIIEDDREAARLRGLPDLLEAGALDANPARDSLEDRLLIVGHVVAAGSPWR
jgi:hypothetical protein